MRTFGKFLGRLLLLVLIAGAALWLFGAREQISVEPGLTDADVGEDVDAYLSAQEARFDDIVPGTQKRVIWHGEVGSRTPLAIVYVHGFSASSEEIRPVPDNVAAEFGANLVFTRLEGHGRDGQALANATAQGWAHDFAEAIAVGRKVADEVVVIATSTGGTVVAAMADQPDVMKKIKGIVFVSPNFSLNNPAAPLLTWPAAREWVPMLVGEERSFETFSEGHATYWTTSYPTVAVLQMAELVKQTRGMDFSTATLPAMFVYSDADQVVSPDATKAVAESWGGPVTMAPQVLSEGSDPNSHVIAGDILSSGETARVSQEIINFVNGL